MNSLENSLHDISFEYSIFQKDQVLTDEQLNSVTRYLDDQDRLNRLHLAGAGIVCGLRVGLSGSQVTLSRGIGITTDGDLMRIPGDMSYRRFKPYDQTYPAYDALYSGVGTMFKAYELVAVGQSDPLARNLTQFSAETGLALEGTVAVLLMESYIKTHDLCSGADCDNHSQEYVGNVKLLLVEKAALAKLLPVIQTADGAARSLNPIVAERALFAGSISDLGQLNAPFRRACQSMHAELIAEFDKLWPSCSFLLAESFNADPTPRWATRLNAIRSAFGSDQKPIQYYYDFLRDLVDTWNDMREMLFGESAWCCPDIDGFPKHLLLGMPGAAAAASEHRFGFYPSAAVNRDNGPKRFRFLAEKIDVLLSAFDQNDPAALPANVTVTPSFGASVPLEQRAIPCYYRIDGQNPTHVAWNHLLSQRGMEQFNYSCNAQKFAARGAASRPLNSAIDRNDFFRIEGHIGRNVRDAEDQIRDLIRQFNLPFGVCSVLIGNKRSDLVIKPFPRYTDLNRFHYLIRQDLVQKMDEVSSFSDRFEGQLTQAIQKGVVRDDDAGSDSTPVSTIVTQKSKRVKDKAAAARMKLGKQYRDFIGDKSWMQDLGETIVAAGQFKQDLHKVVQTNFPTSFDSLIGNTTLNWLPWLDKFIQDKNASAEEKTLFAKFLAGHPALEHAGGVVRGGSFVLVYQPGGKVVADFMLAACCEEEVEEEVAEPPLQKPDFPILEVLEGGIKVNPSREGFIGQKMEILKLDIDRQWAPKLELQKNVSVAMADIVDLARKSVTSRGAVAAPAAVFTPGGLVAQPGANIELLNVPAGIRRIEGQKTFADVQLGAEVDRAREEIVRIQKFDEQVQDPAVPDEQKALIQKERSKAQTRLAGQIERVATRVDKENVDTTFGAEGGDALEVVSTGLAVLRDNDRQLTESKKKLNALKAATGNKGLQTALTHVLINR